MMWDYLIKSKNEVFQKFKDMDERQSGKFIKVLRTNGEKEYTSKEFKSFCMKLDIHHKVTTPYALNTIDRQNKGTKLCITWLRA